MVIFGRRHYFDHSKQLHFITRLTGLTMSPNWFIALEAPIDLDLDHILRLAPKSIRRFHPLDRHLTLAFLGNCSVKKAQQAWANACKAAPFVQHLQPKRLHAMGARKKPSAAAIVFREPEKITNWMKKNQSGILAEAGRPPMRWDPLPHLTIARPKRKAGKEIRQAMVDWCTKTELHLECVIMLNMALYTWSKDRTQQLFRKEAEHPLLHRCHELNCSGHNHEWERCTTNGF